MSNRAFYSRLFVVRASRDLLLAGAVGLVRAFVWLDDHRLVRDRLR